MSAFEGYMTFGGVELLNNPRVRGIAESAQPCPMYWLRGPECDTLADALGQVGDYNWNRADQAPWYDPDLADVSSRFFGIYAYSITGIYDSTRRADVTESTLAGGVVGATRKGSKRVTVRALVMARGRDALEYGMTWLNGTLDPDGCGKLGGNCETADIEFLVDCPPERPNEWIYGEWSTIWTNLATNPSFETASGTVEVRRNLVVDPAPGVGNGWGAGNFGTGGAGSAAIVAGATPDGVGSGYVKTWSTASTNNTNASLDAAGLSGTLTNGTPLPASTVYSASMWFRAGVAGTYNFLAIERVDAATNASVITLESKALAAGQWYQFKGTRTSGATTTSIRLTVNQVDASVSPIGTTWAVARVLVESGITTFGTYFDGATQPKVRRNLVANPAMALPGSEGALVTGWTGVTQQSGKAVVSVAGTAAYTADMPAIFGLPVSARVVLAAATAVTATVQLRETKAGSFGSQPIAATQAVPIAAGGQVEVVLAGTMTGVDSTGFRVSLGAVAANTLQVVRVLAEAASAAGTYFDGSTGAPAGFTAAWEGTANASASYLYDSDFTTAWTGTANASASVLSGALTANTGPGSAGDAAYRVSSTRWAASGSKSARLIPSSASTASRLRLSGYDFSVFQAGKTYTVLGTLYMEAPQSGTVASDARRIVASTNVGTLSTSSASPNAAGAYEHRLTFTVPPSATWATVLLMNGASLGNGDVWWDNLLIIEGTYDGPYFDGSTPNPADDGSHGPLPVIQNIWTGTANASTSQQQLRSATLTPVSDVTYAPLVNESRRFLKGGSVISGPFITDTKSKGEFWAHWVEFTFAVEKPWVYQKTTPLTLTPSLPTVVQDVPYNLAPYPSAELASGTVIVAENLSTNPSVETNATGWTASGSAVSGAAPTIAGARSTELAASGLASFLATATGTGVAVHDVIDYQDVTVAPVTGSRYSFTIWGAMLFTGSGGSGISLGAKVEWRNGGGTVLRTDTIGTPITSAFAGQVFALKSVAPPAGAVTARVIVTGRANFTASTVAKVFADALAVTIP